MPACKAGHQPRAHTVGVGGVQLSSDTPSLEMTILTTLTLLLCSVPQQTLWLLCLHSGSLGQLVDLTAWASVSPYTERAVTVPGTLVRELEVTSHQSHALRPWGILSLPDIAFPFSPTGPEPPLGVPASPAPLHLVPGPHSAPAELAGASPPHAPSGFSEFTPCAWDRAQGPNPALGQDRRAPGLLPSPACHCTTRALPVPSSFSVSSRSPPMPLSCALPPSPSEPSSVPSMGVGDGDSSHLLLGSPHTKHRAGVGSEEEQKEGGGDRGSERDPKMITGETWQLD